MKEEDDEARFIRQRSTLQKLSRWAHMVFGSYDVIHEQLSRLVKNCALVAYCNDVCCSVVYCSDGDSYGRAGAK
eukprot:3749952-Amphidinium_carterae.2